MNRLAVAWLVFSACITAEITYAADLPKLSAIALLCAIFGLACINEDESLEHDTPPGHGAASPLARRHRARTRAARRRNRLSRWLARYA